MKHLKFAHPTIECGGCGTKQTGIVRVASSEFCYDGIHVKQGESYIQCMRSSCKFLLTGAQLDDALTPVIQSPADLRTINNYSHDQGRD